MSSDFIIRTVKSFTKPYPCAKLIFQQHIIKVSNVSIVQTDISDEELQRIEPGKIISAQETIIRVKVDDKIIDLECVSPLPVADLLKAKYIYPPTKYFAEYFINNFSNEWIANIIGLEEDMPCKWCKHNSFQDGCYVDCRSDNDWDLFVIRG